jgi:hypothetical protein
MEMGKEVVGRGLERVEGWVMEMEMVMVGRGLEMVEGWVMEMVMVGRGLERVGKALVGRVG